MLHGFLKAVSDFSTLLLQTHIDEVKHNHPAEITQSQLPGDFVNGFTVGGVGVGLGILGRAGTPRVHIDGHQSFGLINDKSTTRFQRNFTLEQLSDLGFHSVCVEEGRRPVVEHHWRRASRSHNRKKRRDTVIS